MLCIGAETFAAMHGVSFIFENEAPGSFNNKQGDENREDSYEEIVPESSFDEPG